MREKSATQQLAELAERQHGVASGEQLRGIGISAKRASREAASGRLHRLHQGVYAVGHAAASRHGRALAAVLACGPGALLSHESAAWLWGISNRFAAPPEVTTTHTVRHRRDEIVVHSAKTIREQDRAEVERIPVAAVPRVLLDLAAASARNLEWALPRAKRLGLLDLIEIDSMLRRSSGLRGVRRLRVALEPYRELAFTRSALELRFLSLVKSAGLPPPSMNFFVGGYELDAYWPELRFAVELDTYEFHGDEISFERDRLRQAKLKLMGIETIPITGRRIDLEPEAVIANLRRLLDQRRRALLLPPAELPVSLP